MIACLDVYYRHDQAHAAAIVFDEWDAVAPVAKYTSVVSGSAKYEPGRFYERELEPLLAVVDQIVEPIDVFIVDGYCYLSADRAPGLGAYFYSAINKHASVIGVAKSRFGESTHAHELFRGSSTRPLFITSLGLRQQAAAAKIAAMAGRFRVPTLLKAVDRLARNGVRG